VGRKRELALLRKALKSARTAGAPRAALVVGPAGTGKSRLVAELARRARGTRTLWGRCLSYGDGITYWPLREAVSRASETDERETLREALAADPPPPAAEIALLFRRFCQAAAREKPLVLVFDDVHWAEPTLLELIEGVVDRGEGPILVACLARSELLEDRPAFLEGRENVDRIPLGPLAPDEAESVLDGLAGAVLETDQRARIVERAEGNPLFLQQLLAFALEGGLATDALPPTVQAVLAARLDRLGPGERAVLERGAVVGKEFTAGDVAALLAPEAVPTAAAHLATLADRGFVRPLGDGAFAFRHILVRDAAYRAAPKRLRAELHERFADRLDESYSHLPDLDEFAGYHLEQAHRLRSELGESDRRTAQLAEDGGRRLGSAGTRAFKRGDMHASSSLLGRSTRLLAADDPQRRDLVCDLGLAYYALQEPDRAVDLLKSIVDEPVSPSTAGTQARARIELEYIRIHREPGTTADALLQAIADGIPTFERLGDQRALGRSLLLSGWVRGGHRGNHAAWAEAAERALVLYRVAGWPLSLCLGQIAIALYWGPTPVADAISRIETLLDEAAPDRQGAANLETFLGGLVAQLGDFDRARALATSARAALDDLGLRASALTYSATVLGEIELLAGNAAGAETVLRALCSELEESENLSQLASRAGELAEALAMLGRLDEAEAWTSIAERYTAVDDLNAQIRWRPVRASLEARRGAVDQAERLAREGADAADATDDLNRRAKAYEALAEALRAAGRIEQAAAACRQAIELYEQKGNRVGVARLRAPERDLASV
jgi:tetratricopeptide (TPR) repeat protein